MARLRLDVDRETYERLLDAAAVERRPPSWQAEVMLRRALGLPFPPPADPSALQCADSPRASARQGGSNAAP